MYIPIPLYTRIYTCIHTNTNPHTKNKAPTYPLYVVPKSTPTTKRSVPRNSDAATEAADANEEFDDAVAMVRAEFGRIFKLPNASDSGRAIFIQRVSE